jgi:tRNA-uridine 2-sulfurtransferase
MAGGRVVVGMSGGVDSSVAAALLVEEGLDVVGVTLRVWPWREPEDARARFGSCCSAETVDDARQVARRLGIPYYLLNSEQEFDRRVIDEFQREYAAGRTPVPCVSCNRDLKFGSLLGRARAWDASAVATGHYARIQRDEARGRFLLLRAVDPAKDQSDFLWPLTQEQLAHARFPVGHLTKSAVRTRARELGLVTADKPESQEICFVPDGDYRAFLRRRAPDAFRPGPIVDGAGRLLGRHAGLPSYTVGQRRGLGLATPRPLYVTRLDPGTNTVVVGPAEEVEAPALLATRVNLIARPSLEEPLPVMAKIRHGHQPVPATITPHEGAAGSGLTVAVHFAEPQRAVTPGQSVVFYEGEIVVGGGIINAAC